MRTGLTMVCNLIFIGERMHIKNIKYNQTWEAQRAGNNITNETQITECVYGTKNDKVKHNFPGLLGTISFPYPSLA